MGGMPAVIGAVNTHKGVVIETVVVLVQLVLSAKELGFGHDVCDDLHHGVVWEPELCLRPVPGAGVKMLTC